MPTRLQTPPSGGDVRLAPAYEELASGRLRVLSVDVFDTLLFRRVTDPVDAFELVGERLRAEAGLRAGVTPAVFARARHAAEVSARERRAGSGEGLEVTLEEIHALLPRGLFACPPAAVLAAELAVEADLLVPDLDVAALLEAAAEAEVPVVAVSDTPFSERQLRRFIARGALADVRFQRIFASSEHRTGKGSGLFSIVLEQLGVAPGDVLHVGDNHEADVAAARRLGMRAVYFEKRTPALQRIVDRERLHLPPTHAADGGTAALRGKVLHRADAQGQPAGVRPFWEFGAASLGPAFAGFADWVREQAGELGASRVFCLMREGELLSRLVNAAGADRLAEPLWLSRHVAARASIREGTVQELEALFARRDMPTVREFCASLGVSLEELPDFAGVADRRVDDRALGDEVVDAIVFDPELRAKVVARSSELRRRLLRYVESRLPAGESRLVLVDLGWGGTIQALAESLLRESGVECTTAGLYLVTNHVALDRALDGLEVRGFLGDYGVPQTAIDAIGRSPELLEQVCMPDFGTQVGLTEELQPVLAEPGEMTLQSVERAAVQEGILAFQREWRRYREAEPASARLSLTAEPVRPRLLAMVARAVTAPTPEEAPLFSGWLHDENFGSDRVESIAAGPGVKALGHMDPRALMKVPMTELYWPFGLAGLHDEHLAGALAAASSGALPWETFSSSLETGPFVIEGDFGWGFEDRAKGTIEPRRNRRGLSYARANVRGEFVQRLRLRPARRPCLLRLDWVRVRCRLHGGGSATVELDTPADFRRLKVSGAHWAAPGVLMVTSGDPRLVLDLRKATGGKVYEAIVEVGFAALALPHSRARERFGRLKDWLRRVAKETPLGAPLRLARRLAR